MDLRSKQTTAPSKPSHGVYEDIRTLHANGSASLAELKQFLGTLHGKSPQEVIGIVSTSLLVQSMLIALAGSLAVLFIFTLGPYLVYGPPSARETAKKPAAAAASPAAASPAASTPATAAVQAPATSQPDAEAASKALGIDETKPADPGKNPLDNPSLDKLLDGVD